MNEKTITCHDCHGFKQNFFNIYQILIVFFRGLMFFLVHWIMTTPMIMSHMGICTCRKVCSTSACIASEHFGGPIHETMIAFCFFSPINKGQPPPSYRWLPSKDKSYFKSGNILACSLCLSFSGPSSIVYELLQYYFVPITFASGFEFLKIICGHIYS
jgi:hypothetical protein